MFGTGVGYGSGRAVGHGRTRPDLRAMIADAARACARTHSPPPGWKATLDVETTLDEVVDVGVGAGSDAAMATCLGEAAWAPRLDHRFATCTRTTRSRSPTACADARSRAMDESTRSTCTALVRPRL